MRTSRVRYDILNVQSETRTCCGFRENMIREANRPCDEVAFKWLVCAIFESLIQKCITFKYINEDEAADFLADHNNYLRTACYRIVYPKYQAGKDKVLKHFFMCEV